MNLDFTTLAIISVLTTLSTECIKELFKKAKVSYVSNVIAAIMAVILSTFLMIIRPVVVDQTHFSPAMVYNAIEMAFFAVLCATLSFDKIKQAIVKIQK